MNDRPDPPRPGRGRPSDETLRQLLQAALLGAGALPPRWRAAGAAAVLLAAALLGVTVAGYDAIDSLEILYCQAVEPWNGGCHP